MNRDSQTSDTILCLHPDEDPAATHRFRLESTLGTGGSARVFRVLRLDEKGGSVCGTLKQFTRAGQAVTTRLRLVCRSLRRFKRQETLSVFIPYMVLYADDEGRPALFTPEDRRGITLARYLEELGPASDTEALCQVLAAVCAASLAVWQLNRQRALLLDIKPDNILLIQRESPAGGPTYLQDSVELFDTDSLLEGSPQAFDPLWLPQSPGFTAPELGGARTEPRRCAIGPASDVYALAATLFHALTGQLYPPEDGDLHTALLRGRFGPVLPAEAAGQLTDLLERALQFNAYQRMNSCAQFARGLDRILDGLRRTAARQEDRDRRELVARLSRMFAYLFYRWPCYLYTAGGHLRVALVSDGDEEAVFAALDALVTSCPVAGKGLQITVAMPDAGQTVARWYVRMQDPHRLFDLAPGPDWGPCDWEQTAAQIRWLDCTPDEESVEQLCTDLDTHYWLLLMRDADRAETLAIDWPEDDFPTFVACTLPGRRPPCPRISGTTRQVFLSPATVDDVFAEQADRMAFAAHLLYEQARDPHVQEATARSTFAAGYNRQASLETGLAVKYRLFSAGVVWNGDPDAMARAYRDALDRDPALADRLSWLEHRRWMLSKMVQGAHRLPDTEYSLLLDGGAGYAGTHLNREGRLYHAYLVPSRLGPRPAGWRIAGEWKAHPLDEPLPAGLDALDRAGITLYRMYARAAGETDLSGETQALRRQTGRLSAWLRAAGRHTAARALDSGTETLLTALEAVEAGDPAGVNRWEAARHGLADTLTSLRGRAPWVTACEGALELLRANSFCLVQRLRSPDPKVLDDTLIQNLPRLLTAGAPPKGES